VLQEDTLLGGYGFMDNMKIKQLLEFIAQSLVDDKNQVTVNLIEGEKFIVLELKVAENDMGKVIGKGGRIANAIRTVMKAAGVGMNKRISVEIIQ